MTSKLLPAVIIDPPGSSRATVLWLHGLGASGHDFEPLVPMLGLSPEDGVRFVFPHAPKISVTLNGGMVMPAWYDIRALDLDRSHDRDGIETSAAQLVAWIEAEKVRGIPIERILLAGFSQGGAIALHVALRYPEKLAGVMALSTYLVCQDDLEAERSMANADIPIFQAHGSMDPMVLPAKGAQSRDKMIALGYEVEWHSYPMEHAVCPDEIADIAQWLQKRLQ